MGSFRRLGDPFGTFGRVYGFGGGNKQPGFHWIRSLTFEAGALISNPTGFDASVGANLSVTQAAALRDNYGFQIDIPTIANRFGQITPINLTSFRLSFLFDRHTLAMANLTSFDMIRTVSIGATGVSIILSLRYTIAAGFEAQLSARNDAGATLSGGFMAIPCTSCMFGIDWKASDYAGANNGFARLYVNNAVASAVENIDNDGHNVSFANIGIAFGIDPGTNGTIYYDNIRYSDRII